ncbi:MAG: hypothetical protein ACPG77_05755, partial [Nannocystaceae bacterium]
MQVIPIIGVLALAAALGSLLVGYGVLLPSLEQAALIDANLSHALAQPLYLRVGVLVLLASIALAAVVPKWSPNTRATPVALALAGAAAVHRLFILPARGEAWARVDAVAQRPIILPASLRVRVVAPLVNFLIWRLGTRGLGARLVRRLRGLVLRGGGKCVYVCMCVCVCVCVC